MLIFNRFLFPSSILHAYETKDTFFDSFDFELEDCYRALNYFESYSEEIQALLASKTKEMFGRDPHLGYWDVTNYYFEIPYEDDDERDDKAIIRRFDTLVNEFPNIRQRLEMMCGGCLTITSNEGEGNRN